MSQLNSHLCSVCNEPHLVKPSHKETLNKNLLTGLQFASRSILASGHNDFDLHELFDQYNLYNNFQKLRYFGLVHHYRNADKQKVRGHWLITRNGWAFLRGELQMPKYLLVRENHIVSRADVTIGVKDVYYGSDTIQTNFEYYDDDGNQVGFRPGVPAPKPIQGSLL